MKAEPPDEYDDDVDGAYFKIRDFDSATSTLDSNRKYARAEARNAGSKPGIPRGGDTYIDATLYLDSNPGGCGNSMSLKAWWKSSGDIDPVAVPAHSWAVQFPVPVPGRPGFFKHTFVMKNPETLATLRVGSLTFLTSRTRYDDFREIPFPDRTHHHLVLNPLQSVSIDVIADATCHDGYVYFAFDLFDPANPRRAICNGWGAHRISTLVPDRPEVSITTGGTQTLSLLAGAGHAGKTYQLVGSLSGTRPGIPLGAERFPLNWDAYCLTTLIMPNRWPLTGSLGVLDARGEATATFSIPRGLLPPSTAGLVLHHAYVIFEKPGTAGIRLISNPVPVRLIK